MKQKSRTIKLVSPVKNLRKINEPHGTETVGDKREHLKCPRHRIFVIHMNSFLER